LRDREKRLLHELMKDSRRSDRELAKLVGVSQPTISRMLRKMKQDLSMTFTASADLDKLGFEVIAVTFGKLQQRNVDTKKIQHLLEDYRGSIIFASTGTSSGMDSDRMIISVHKSYSDYAKFRNYLNTQWEGTVLTGNSFLMSARSEKVIKPLSTQDLLT